jgi:hypothetical protein
VKFDADRHEREKVRQRTFKEKQRAMLPIAA